MDQVTQELLRTAARLRSEGRLVQSIDAYRRLLAIAPENADAWYDLAHTLRLAGQYDAALAAYAEALARGVSRPEELHVNRAVIYSESLQRDDLAKAELLVALTHRQDFEPALSNLGALEENAGRRAEAAELFHKTLDQKPDNATALARYANALTISGPDDPVFDRLVAARQRDDLEPVERASVGFALGRALDAAGLYDRAFAAYADANADSRRAMTAGQAAYDAAAQEAFVAKSEQVFSTRPAIIPPPAADRAAPLFICGMFRSGSTLVEQILAAHPRGTLGGELDLLPRLVRNSLQPYPRSLSTAAPARLQAYAAAYLAHVNRLFPGADVITDKRPDNFLYVGLIKTLFPDAKIINTMRHPLDNSLSVYFLNLDHSMGYASDLSDIGHYYRQYRRLMAHWKALYGADILDFDYDAYVRAPRAWTAKLLAFCGLEWNEACTEFHRNTNAVRTASAWQVREPLYTSSSGRWRNYENQLGELAAQLGDFLTTD